MQKDAQPFITRPAAVYILAIISCMLWGSAFPAIKTGYSLLAIAPEDTASQILFAGVRFALSGLIAIAIFSIPAKRLLVPKKKELGQSCKTRLGADGHAVYVFLHRTGQRHRGKILDYHRLRSVCRHIARFLSVQAGTFHPRQTDRLPARLCRHRDHQSGFREPCSLLYVFGGRFYHFFRPCLCALLFHDPSVCKRRKSRSVKRVPVSFRWIGHGGRRPFFWEVPSIFRACLRFCSSFTSPSCPPSLIRCGPCC